jgi:hypothetical protein
LQSLVPPATHSPFPSQNEAATTASPAHAAAAHEVEVPGRPAQLPRTMPSQLAAPQASPPALQAVRAPCGVPVTAVQVPTEPVTSHASH